MAAAEFIDLCVVCGLCKLLAYPAQAVRGKQGLSLRYHSKEVTGYGLPDQRPEASVHEGLPARDLNLASDAEISLPGKNPEPSVPSGSPCLEFQ